MHQRSAHGSGRLPTLRRIFGERSLNHFGHAHWYFGSAQSQWDDRIFKDSFDGSSHVLFRTNVERSIAREQTVGRHSERIDIGSGTYVTKVFDLLRPHIS